MTALDSGWISSNKGKSDQGQLRIYGPTDPFYALSEMPDSVSKEWANEVKEQLDEGDGEDDEEDDEEVFSRLNSLSDSEDGMFNLSKVLVSPTADDVRLQQQVVSAQQQQFGFHKIHQTPQQLTISPVTRINRDGEEVTEFDVVDLDPLYALGSGGNQLDEQRSLSVDYSLLQSIGTDNTFPMHEGEVLNVPLQQQQQQQQQNNTAISWNAGIFENWCNSVDPVVPASYHQKQHLQSPAAQNIHRQHLDSQEQSQTVQPISQQQLQQQHVQQQIMDHMNQIQQQRRFSKTGLAGTYDGSPQSAGRVYKRSKSVCAGIVSNDSGHAVGPAISMSLHQPHGIVGSTSRGLKQSGNSTIGSNSSSSSSQSSTHSNHSSVSSISGLPAHNDFRRGSCSSLYEVGAGHQSIITHVPNLAAHGSHHPAIYKYVAQAQLSMQCDTTKVEMENKAQWLSLSPMTPERKSHIICKLQEKNVLLDTVYEVFELFPQQQYLKEKLEILAMEFEPHFSKLRGTEETSALMAEDSNSLNKWIWLDQRKKRHPGQLKQFPRHTVRASSKGKEWPYEIEVRTSSGYNNFTNHSNSESGLSHLDFLLLRLRHMNLLRESDDRKRKTKYYEFIEGKMKRPLNSFMLYRSSLMKALSILKVVKIVSDLVAVVQKELPSCDEFTVLSLLQETVKYRHGLSYQESSHIQRLSEIIDEQLYKPCDSRPSSHGNNSKVSSKARIPIDPKFSNHTVLAQVITLMWNSELNHCREEFVKFSKLEKDHHHLVYPKYKYCPVKKLKLEELEHNLTVRNLSSDLLDSFKNANGGS